MVRCSIHRSLVVRGWPFALQDDAAILEHGIVAAPGKGMAAQKARERHHASAQHAVTLNRLHRVFRAGGNVAARRREQGRYCPLVGSQEPKHDEFGEVTQISFRTACAVSLLPSLL